MTSEGDVAKNVKEDLSKQQHYATLWVHSDSSQILLSGTDCGLKQHTGDVSLWPSDGRLRCCTGLWCALSRKFLVNEIDIGFLH